MDIEPALPTEVHPMCYRAAPVECPVVVLSSAVTRFIPRQGAFVGATMWWTYTPLVQVSGRDRQVEIDVGPISRTSSVAQIYAARSMGTAGRGKFSAPRSQVVKAALVIAAASAPSSTALPPPPAPSTLSTVIIPTTSSIPVIPTSTYVPPLPPPATTSSIPPVIQPPIPSSSSAIVVRPSSTAIIPPLPSATLGSLVVTQNGMCGNSTTCAGSGYGVCCSQYWYCGNGIDYCGTGCNAEFGFCFGAASPPRSSSIVILPPSSSSAPVIPSSTYIPPPPPPPPTTTSIAPVIIPTSSAAPPPSAPTQPVAGPNTSTYGSCGGTGGKTCLGSTFGNCCSQYGYCGSQPLYCSPVLGCNAQYGTCDPSKNPISVD
ncbi:carbohydrate-binding module family 18 [Hyaloscypha variabilis]